MAVQLDMGGRTGGAVPSKRETAEVRRYAQEMKLASAQWEQERRSWQVEGERRAQAQIAKVLAQAKARGDRRAVVSMLQAMAGKARAEAAALHHQLDMMKWHMAVDALSIVDPTPASMGVSIWMDIQEAGM